MFVEGVADELEDPAQGEEAGAEASLPDLLLFGGFLIWAVADRISFKRRVQRPLQAAPPSRFNDAIAIVAGLVLYFVFMRWLHVRWIGVSPMPVN